MANAAKYLGRNMLVAVGGDVIGDAYVTVADMKTTSMDLGTEAIDVTDKDSEDHWREQIAGGVRQLDISVAGNLSSVAVIRQTLMSYSVEGTIKFYKLTSAMGDIFQGLFQVRSLSRTGENKGSEEYTLKLESCGKITYTAAT